MPEVKGQEPRVKHTARLHSAAAIIIKERFLASSLDSYRHLFCFKFFFFLFFKRSLFSILVKHKHKTHYQQQVTPCSAWANQITASRAAVRLVRLIRSGQHEPQEKKKLSRSRSNKAAADWRTRTLRSDSAHLGGDAHQLSQFYRSWKRSCLRFLSCSCAFIQTDWCKQQSASRIAATSLCCSRLFAHPR